MAAGTRTILHVDDDDDIRFVVGLTFQSEPDLTVVSHGDPEQALAAAAEAPPDLVLVDVMMPGMDGVTFLARLRDDRRLADIPVVFITAKAYPQELEHLRGLGVVAVIAKPFDPVSLPDQVRSLLADLSAG